MLQVCNASLRLVGRINDDAKWHERKTKGSINKRLSLSLFDIKTFELHSSGPDSTEVSKMNSKRKENLVNGVKALLFAYTVSLLI